MNPQPDDRVTLVDVLLLGGAAFLTVSLWLVVVIAAVRGIVAI